jgi:hypothetical protein
VVAVVHSLSKSKPEKDHLLKFAIGHTLDRTPLVVDADTIASTAFMLPCLEDTTNNDIDNAIYFVVIPHNQIGRTLAGMKTNRNKYFSTR